MYYLFLIYYKSVKAQPPYRGGSGWIQAKTARLLGLTPRRLGFAPRKYTIEIKRI